MGELTCKQKQQILTLSGHEWSTCMHRKGVAPFSHGGTSSMSRPPLQLHVVFMANNSIQTTDVTSFAPIPTTPNPRLFAWPAMAEK